MLSRLKNYFVGTVSTFLFVSTSILFTFLKMYFGVSLSYLKSVISSCSLFLFGYDPDPSIDQFKDYHDRVYSDYVSRPFYDCVVCPFYDPYVRPYIDYFCFLYEGTGFGFESFFILVVLVVCIVFCVVFLLGAIAFCTVFERKSIAVLQNRRGPNRAGFFGLLQAIGDGVKLVTKAQISKKQTSTYLYFFAPFCALFLSWFFAFYLTFHCMDDFSIYYLLIWTSLNVYSVPVAGLVTSHSKFAFLGGVRSLSQLLSYELSLTVLFLTVVVYTGTPVLGEVVEFQVNNLSLCCSLFPVFVLWFVLLLAETNRVPFDLPEAEAELVAGFATEYSSFAFAAFFLAEYGSMLLYSYLTALIFFGSCNTFVITVGVFFLFVWARTTFPRFKVDQLLWIGWSLYCHCH